MTSEQLKQVEELFHKAKALEPADRANFLDEACAGALDLRAEVESLLAHSDGGTSRMVLRPSDVSGATLIDRGRPSEGPGVSCDESGVRGLSPPLIEPGKRGAGGFTPGCSIWG